MTTKRDANNPEGCLLNIRLIPGAKKNQIVAISEAGIIKVKVTQPAVEGKANAGLIKYLAKNLDVAPSYIQIDRGEKSREKSIRISGISYDIAMDRLKTLMG